MIGLFVFWHYKSEQYIDTVQHFHRILFNHKIHEHCTIYAFSFLSFYVHLRFCVPALAESPLKPWKKNWMSSWHYGVPQRLENIIIENTNHRWQYLTNVPETLLMNSFGNLCSFIFLQIRIRIISLVDLMNCIFMIMNYQEIISIY